MFVFIIVEIIAAAYALTYAWHCAQNKKSLAMSGAALLACLALFLGVMLWWL